MGSPSKHSNNSSSHEPGSGGNNMLSNVRSSLRSRRNQQHNNDSISTEVTAATAASSAVAASSSSPSLSRRKRSKSPSLRKSLQEANVPLNDVATTTTTHKKKQNETKNDPTTNTALSTQSSAVSTTSSTPAIMTGEQVKKDETRSTKILQRIVIGVVLMSSFCGVVGAGHWYICLLVAFIETLLFQELVRVRYSAHYEKIENTIPLFRTTQWMWFVVAIVYTYGDFVSDVVQNHSHLHRFLAYTKYTGSISFVLYSTTLMVTIISLQREHLKFQINQASWTVVVLCLTLGQLKYVMHNIFNGLIWFVLPVCLVIVNDIMAYVCGMSMGRKFIQRPFLRSVSPNKTWEGFLGAGFCTMVVAWYLSKALAQYKFMICPVMQGSSLGMSGSNADNGSAAASNNAEQLSFVPFYALSNQDCTPEAVFVRAQWVFPSQLFELLPQSLVKALPGVVQICATPLSSAAAKELTNSGDPFFSSDGVGGSSSGGGGGVPPVVSPTSSLYELEPCISGHEQQVHHHFELRVKDNFYPIQVHALWLALFASVVAPFGGFLASAIKRAYGVKDFAAVLPGHGGVTDRMDCQFLMALCTWVYYNTFIKIATVSVTKLTYLYSLLTPAEQDEFVQWIKANANK